MKYLKAIAITFLICCTLLSCDKKQKQAKGAYINDEADIYEIVNLALEDHKNEIVVKKCVVTELGLSQKFREYLERDVKKKSSVDQHDKTEMLAQLNDTAPIVLKRASIRRDVKFISPDSLNYLWEKWKKDGSWQSISEKYGDAIVVISKPIFTKDRKQALIIVEWRGLLGGGNTYHMRKTANRWEIYETSILWMS